MTPQRPWWQTEVIYQIYPRSFQDSNDDSIGDLPGITSRLDYLQDLGIGAIWLSPIYPSPMHDFGYDVSDYVDISPEFGTMDDFKTLLSEAHRRNIRILMDLVLNHTSHKHAWFKRASSTRDNPKRDWYIWHDGKPGSPPKPPNNWQAAFGGRAWEWDAHTEQFYLHSFLKEQPDVNWRNPELQNAMWNVIRFWLNLGVDGFRLDVVNWFIKDKHFRNNPHKYWGLRPYDWQHHLYDRNRPETLEIMKQIRAVVDEYPDRMTVGEVFTEAPGDPELVATYYGDGEGLHLAFNFTFLYCPWRATAFADAVDCWETLLGPNLWPNYTLSNHDQPRAFSRYARGKDSVARARVAAAMLLTLRGTPFVYYGEEIGMRNGRIPRSRLQDPVGKRYWPFYPGRDGARTPMQWNASLNAGFSQAEPWLPVNKDYQAVNAETQQQRSDSLLNWYHALIQLRKNEPALHSGSYRCLSVENEVFCFERRLGDELVVVALNFTPKEREVRLPEDHTWQTLLSVQPPHNQAFEAKDARLQSYDVLIVKATDC
jgi:alpha-glucosidase